MRKDVLIVVVSLALIALVGIVGLVVLSYAAKPVDSSLIALIATAVGALASLLARTTGSEPPAAPAVNVSNKVVPLAALALLVSGCSLSFEEARLAGLKAHPASAAAEHRDDARCAALDDGRISAGANAKGLAVIGGVAGAGGGISEAVLGAPKWVGVSAAVVALLAGAGAAHQFVTAEGRGAAWARECSGGTP